MVVVKSALMSRVFVWTWMVAIAIGLTCKLPNAGAQPAPAADAAASGLEGYTEQTFTDAEGNAHRYRLLFPAGYQEDADTKYPLVLLLHGAGERGDDNRAQLRHGAAEFARADRQAAYPCFVVVPQVPRESRWVDADWGQRGGRGTFPDKPSPSMQAALGIVRHWIATGRVEPERVYVTGLSMGGYGSWYAGAHANDLFAAAVPICGGGDPSWTARYGKLPIWAFHGTEDRAVPVERSREMVAALRTAGHEPEPKYTEYEGAGHDVWTQTYRRDDLFEWLFSQRRAQP